VSAGELPFQTVAGVMPAIGLRKFLKVQANIEVVSGRLCPSDGQCHNMGTIASP